MAASVSDCSWIKWHIYLKKKKTQNSKLVAYWLFERHEQLAAVAGVVGGGAPCRVTTWLESAKKNAVLK